MCIRGKLKEWFNRYAVAEFLGLLFALVSSNILMFLFGNIFLSGFIATWAENLGFYGTIVYRDLNQRKKLKKRKKLTLSDYLTELRNCFIEFGPAEYLDSFVIRPLYFSILPIFISNYSLAILIGSVLANVTYYLPVIAGYELRKRALHD